MKISALPVLSAGFTPTADMLPIVHAGQTSSVTPALLIANYLTSTTINIPNLVVSGSLVVPGGGSTFLPIAGGTLTGPLQINLNAVVTAAAAQFHIQSADGGSIQIMMDAIGATIPFINGRRANGTASAKTAPTVGQGLFIVGAAGWTPAGYTTANRGEIQWHAAEGWTNTANGTFLSFWTTKIGTTAMFEAMRIADDGALLIGKTVNAGTFKLDVIGNTRTDTLTTLGVTTLALDPVNPLEAATKRYVDGHAPRILSASWLAGTNPNNVILGVLDQGGTVVSVTGVPEVINGTAATVTPYWVASGAALGVGTALTTNSFDARGAAGSTQTLTLSGSVTVPAGGRIGLRTTGSFDFSVGNISVRVA